MKSIWVLRNRENNQFWNGFGFTTELVKAKMYSEIPSGYEEYITVPMDAIELRLVERE